MTKRQRYCVRVRAISFFTTVCVCVYVVDYGSDEHGTRGWKSIFDIPAASSLNHS